MLKVGGELSRFFAGDYLEGEVYSGTQYKPDSLEAIPTFRFDADDGPVHVWAHAFDLRQLRRCALDEALVLYHFTNEFCFRNVGNPKVLMAELFASLEDKKAHYGKGLYATQYEPATWGLKIRILLNNFSSSDPWLQNINCEESRRVNEEWGDGNPKHQDKKHPQHRAAFCIPVLVPASIAYDIFKRQTPDMVLRRIPAGDGGERAIALGEDYKGRPAGKNRDVWVIRVVDEKKTLQHAYLWSDSIVELEKLRVRKCMGSGGLEEMLALNRLALFLAERGKLEEAELFQREAVHVGRAKLGDANPYVLHCIARLANVLQDRGKLEEAEPLCREALQGSRALLRDTHDQFLECTFKSKSSVCLPSRWDESIMQLINQLASLLVEMGKLEEAEQLLRESLQGLRAKLGDAHPVTLGPISNLAVLLMRRKKLEEALLLFREVLQGMRAHLGDAHTDTLGAMMNLGVVLWDMGKLEEAEPLIRENLRGCRAKLGDAHPHIIGSMLNLGVLLKTRGKLEEAELLLREALQGSRARLGDAHPHTLSCVNHLGALLRNRGKLEETEPLSREASQGSRAKEAEPLAELLFREASNTSDDIEAWQMAQAKAMGLQSARALSLRLAVAANDQAKVQLGRVLDQEKEPGEDDEKKLVLARMLSHRLASNTSNRAGGQLGRPLHPEKEPGQEGNGQLAQAKAMSLQLALAANRQAHGQLHPTRDPLRETEESEELLWEAMAPRLQLAGAANDQAKVQLVRALHPEKEPGEEKEEQLAQATALSLGNFLAEREELEEAGPLLREALQFMHAKLGDAHPVPFELINNLGTLLMDRGKPEEALPFFRAALQGMRAKLGDAHPHTLGSMNNLGVWLWDRGKLEEAEPLLREALQGNRAKLGDAHPQTFACIENLGDFLVERGKLEEAEPLYSEALQGKRANLGDAHPDTLASVNNLGNLRAQKMFLEEVQLSCCEEELAQEFEDTRFLDFVGAEALRAFDGDDPVAVSDTSKAAAAKALGNAAFTAKNYVEAVEHFTEAISHDPSDHVFFSNRSACLAYLGKYREAFEDGAECVRLRPDWPKGYTRRGLAEVFLGAYDDAAETYKAGLKLAPNDPSLKEGLQIAMDAKYKMFDALATAKPPPQATSPADARTDKQREADDLKDQGNKFYKQRRFEEALAMYDKAIEKERNDLTYYNNKCAVWIELGEKNYSKVLETCQDLIERRYEINTANAGGASFEKVAKVYARMASVYERQRKFDKAAEMVNKSKDNNRHACTAPRELGRVKEKQEREQYVNPKLAEEHRERGNEFFKSNDFAKAKLEYDEAIRWNPADVKLFSNRAAAFTKLLAYPDALRDLEECFRLDPKFVKAYSRKGAAHFLMKEYNNALTAYKNGLEIDKNNEECLKGREQVLSKIYETHRSARIDEEQILHAMEDPEMQRILKDPKMRDSLRQLKENPTKAKRDDRDAFGNFIMAVSRIVAGRSVRSWPRAGKDRQLQLLLFLLPASMVGWLAH